MNKLYFTLHFFFLPLFVDENNIAVTYYIFCQERGSHVQHNLCKETVKVNLDEESDKVNTITYTRKKSGDQERRSPTQG